MAKQQYNYLRLGIMVVLVFAIFTYAVYRIGDRQYFMGNTVTLFADFKDLKGLQTGNNVRFAGINIGSVEYIDIVNDTTLRVQMNVAANAKDYLRKNARAAIGSDGLVGNMIVNITPQKGASIPINAGDFIEATKDVETQEMLRTLANTNEQVAQITDHLLRVMQKVDEGEGPLAMLVNDTNASNDLLSATKDLHRTMSSTATMAKYLEILVAGVKAGDGNLGYLLRDNSLEGEVDNLTLALDTLMSNQVEPTLTSLQEAVEAIVASSNNLEQLLAQSRAPNSTIHLLTDDSLTTASLRKTITSLQNGSHNLEENLEALQYSWPFRKYFRKKKKGKLAP